MRLRRHGRRPNDARINFKRRPNVVRGPETAQKAAWEHGNKGGVTVRPHRRRVRAKFFVFASYARDLRCWDIDSGPGAVRIIKFDSKRGGGKGLKRHF